MVWNRPHVIKELAKQVPASFALHNIGTKHQVSGDFNGIFEKKFRSRAGMNVAKAFVGRGRRAVRGLRGRGKPTLVDSSPVGSEGVEIIGVQLQPAPGNHEGTRHPRWLQPENSFKFVDG